MGEGPPKSQPVLKVLREAMEKSKCGTGLSDVTTQYSGDKARQGGGGGQSGSISESICFAVYGINTPCLSALHLRQSLDNISWLKDILVGSRLL